LYNAVTNYAAVTARAAAKPSSKTATATAKSAIVGPMTEAMFEQLVVKGKPKMTDWVVALQDTGTDQVIGEKKQLTTVFEKIRRVDNQIAKQDRDFPPLIDHK
jgi:hypothetical protein